MDSAREETEERAKDRKGTDKQKENRRKRYEKTNRAPGVEIGLMSVTVA